MKFICIQQCFRDNVLHDVGTTKITDDDDKTDWSKPTKKGETICWRKVGKKTDQAIKDAGDIESKTHQELQKMKIDELILYAFTRYRKTILDPEQPHASMIKEIKQLEKAKVKEDKTGMI
jgi:hypothetical protein